MFEGIPSEMKELRQWVIWGLNTDKPKIPYTPTTRKPAHADNASTWGAFEEAVAVASEIGLFEGKGGIGFEFAGGYCGLDLDHVIDDEGKLKEYAADIVDTMNSYTELSPSGRGLHILFKIDVPLSEIGLIRKNTALGIEVYDTGRYFTVTGKIYGEKKAVANRTYELRKVYAKYFIKEAEKVSKQAPQYPPVDTNKKDVELSARDLLDKMFSSAHGQSIRALYFGDTTGYSSQSEADLALCNHLAYWTDGDAGLIDELFRGSGLYRPKWEERHGAQTYGEKTINEALKKLIIISKSSKTSIHAGLGVNTSIHAGLSSFLGSIGEERAEKEAISEEKLKSENSQIDIRPISYFIKDFLCKIKSNREGRAISTGFRWLDALLDGGLYPGLYSAGAISSLGKTSLCLQMADQIATCGHGALIYSLEMSRNEMIAKSLSRRTLLLDLKKNQTTRNALTTRGVLRGVYSEQSQSLLHEALHECEDEDLSITEGIGNVGVSEIKSGIEKYMSEHEDKPPVVFIDYLQILSPVDMRASDKQNVDKNTLELKRLSRDYQTPIIAISSFNRESYDYPVNMASFKESGAIEYSSDVLIGLQYEGFDYQDIGDKTENANEHIRRVRQLMKQINESTGKGEPAKIQLKVLKNRNGCKGSIRFEYYPRFNYFRESEGLDNAR